ncbi:MULTISPECIES: TetR/AcrR family transcriptional regulator [Paenibacillus]|uniref:TetR/AcrR family transcriptional regulator n=1 Tax=Paenibacillus TaxID=44249 RepID=UPI000B877152|nr:TetR/AcrR family transcriptional regulator [Paenibacillus amylolyticus]
MKYDLAKKVTKGAQRTLDAFTSTMLELLTEKPFHEITVNELCERSSYPRATFYNYFDDKFDLLSYIWFCLYKMVELDDYSNLDSEERLYILFDRAFDLASANQDILKSILRHHSERDFLYHHFRMHLNAKIRDFFVMEDCRYQYNIPYELVVDHYCNTALLILEWYFLKQKGGTKTQALQYLKFLLGSIKTESEIRNSDLSIIN